MCTFLLWVNANLLKNTKAQPSYNCMKLNPLTTTSIVKEDANIGVRESKAGITCLESNGTIKKNVTAESHKK
jgi:hypothetical protein